MRCDSQRGYKHGSGEFMACKMTFHGIQPAPYELPSGLNLNYKLKRPSLKSNLEVIIRNVIVIDYCLHAAYYVVR